MNIKHGILEYSMMISRIENDFSSEIFLFYPKYYSER
jgi:hypothetical protein